MNKVMHYGLDMFLDSIAMKKIYTMYLLFKFYIQLTFGIWVITLSLAEPGR